MLRLQQPLTAPAQRPADPLNEYLRCRVEGFRGVVRNHEFHEFKRIIAEGISQSNGPVGWPCDLTSWSADGLPR